MDMSSSAPAPLRGPGRPQGLPVVKALFSREADTASALSPVTNLALNMNQLAVLGSQCETPKRKLFDRYALPRTHSADSMDAGLGLDSPSSMSLRDLEETFEKAMFDSGRCVNAKLPLGRRRSMPQSGFSFRRNLSESMDCELFHLSDSENKENEPFQFKLPVRPRGTVRSRLHASGKEALVHRQKSAPACMFSSPVKDFEIRSCDLPFVRKSSCTSTSTESSDDGFLDMLDGDDTETEPEIPLGVASLLTAPLVIRRMGPCYEAESPLSRPTLKRTERAQGDVPDKIKRRRSMFEVTDDHDAERTAHLARSQSFSRETIENIFDSDQRDLIGDFSQVFLFPTVSGKHQELRYITPEMMIKISNGHYDPFIERCVIIDCRYPYEYDGGHIKGAINLHMEQELQDYLLKSPIQSHGSKRVVVIFHCEFSSERGPRMCKFLREKDRDQNEYPNLYYPELYILEGGYKDFYAKFKSYCEPQSYRPMLHEDFREDLRKFRMKSRTWAGERSKRELYSRLKKL
ncbi:PREDICTED: M-phase inducer phosphatase 1-like [Nanorana parkeri]|uniref:M-phase inducer phosphatase 1-like n=1 Tax=Nanorana parkeri TaxID=125878 RepID=UPI000854F168|nr:PREDICTED: M-phase inducer phosphatase 1-like [Nanorana parkeri]